jgi:hypothetical protein
MLSIMARSAGGIRAVEKPLIDEKAKIMPELYIQNVITSATFSVTFGPKTATTSGGP